MKKPEKAKNFLTQSEETINTDCLKKFFALLYQIDRRNKQLSSNCYEDQKSRNRPSQAL